LTVTKAIELMKKLAGNFIVIFDGLDSSVFCGAFPYALTIYYSPFI